MKLKIIIYQFRFVFLLILIFLVIYVVYFSTTEKTCCKIVGVSSIRGGGVILYDYEINHRKHKGSMTVGYFKDEISLDSLKKIDCVEMEYSKYLPFLNRITDKRILSE